MIRLGVNLDHIATLRQARLGFEPNPVPLALLAELGGADNITCHLREDQRHIQSKDVELFKETIHIPLNFEMAATKELADFAIRVRPKYVTLVPEKREELTTEGGLDVSSMSKETLEALGVLKENHLFVSLFIEPTIQDVKKIKDLGADAVEFHTGTFAEKISQASTTRAQIDLVKDLQEAAQEAKHHGLQVHFGHGLNYQNAHFLQMIPEAEEANIGHSIISRSLSVGLTCAVKEMKDLLNNPNHKPNFIL